MNNFQIGSKTSKTFSNHRALINSLPTDLVSITKSNSNQMLLQSLHRKSIRCPQLNDNLFENSLMKISAQAEFVPHNPCMQLPSSSSPNKMEKNDPHKIIDGSTLGLSETSILSLESKLFLTVSEHPRSFLSLTSVGDLTTYELKKETNGK